MSNKVKAIDGSVSSFRWYLNDKLGNGFEDYIYEVVLGYINNNYNDEIKVFSTPRSNDGGKDIIVKSNVDIIGLFNQNYYRNGKESFSVFIECKSTDSGSLRFEKVVSNVAKIKELKIDYYVIVTNATITPYTFSHLYNELMLNDINFCLVDQYVLLSFLNKCSSSIGSYIEPKNIPAFNSYYQTYSSIDNGEKCIDVYILCRNLSSHQHFGNIKLLTDRNWDSNVTDLNFLIEPYGAYITKIRIKRAYFDGIDDLFLSLKIGDRENSLHIKNNYLSAIFETKLIGEYHYKCIDTFINWINEDKGLKIYYLWGEAGIGKSRVLDEIYGKASGRKYDFGFFKIKANSDYIKDVKIFLERKYYIDRNEKANTLEELLSKCKSTERRAVLFFDDVHNMDKKLINAIKGILGYTCSVTIILCGRTDFSVGSTDYFSFVQWCIESPAINGVKLKPLKDDETKKLIKTIIDGVPPIIEEKLCRSSKNNPLYIVQFIEYLLEEKLVYLKNRNTVDILNVSTFASKVYIPDEIHLLYKKRCDNLLTHKDGNTLYEFLLILCFLGGSTSFENTIRFFEEDMSYFSELVKRNFIKIDQNGLVSLIHESLYLYINKMTNESSTLKSLVSKSILENHSFLVDNLSKCDKGKLSVWSEDFTTAILYFSDYISELRSINNYSNISIDINVYDYLYVIYKIFEHSKDDYDSDLLKNIILVRIYITLHYKAPINAITECDFAIEKTRNTELLSNENALYYTILEQKAHSMFHAGLLPDGELILKELQVNWLLDKTTFNLATAFDMFDRLCGVYIKYNIWTLAESYSKLSFLISEESGNIRTIAIAYLTKSKLYFYKDPKTSYANLDKLSDLLIKEPSDRIHCSAELSKLILDAVHNNECDWDKCKENALNILKTALTKGFTTSIIRAYMLLAVCSYKTEKSPIFENTRSFIEKGIDTSIKFGVATYIWQFYNLLGIVEINLGYNDNHIYKTFMTSYAMIAKQNLLYLGDLDFCYGNILALSNVGFYLQSHNFETEFYKLMSKISYKNKITLCDYDCDKPECEFICNDSLSELKKEYIKSQNKDILFVKHYSKNLLRDDKTKYFIVMS